MDQIVKQLKMVVVSVESKIRGFQLTLNSFPVAVLKYIIFMAITFPSQVAESRGKKLIRKENQDTIVFISSAVISWTNACDHNIRWYLKYLILRYCCRISLTTRLGHLITGKDRQCEEYEEAKNLFHLGLVFNLPCHLVFNLLWAVGNPGKSKDWR